VVSIYKQGVRSAVENYRSISINTVFFKQLEHVTAGYVRQVWDTNDWLYERQHGFRPGYSWESQVIAVYQDIANYFEEGVLIDSIIIIIEFPKAFDFVPYYRLLTKLFASEVDSRVVVWVREFFVGRTQRV
jgi:hypothetical protein